MLLIRPADRRGRSDRGGVQRLHAFSCAQYYDPQWMGFGALRVLNEERLAPGAALAPQRRANMDLVDIVLGGRLACRDGSGGECVLEAGGLRWIGAGHGIEHADSNPDPARPAHRLQAWIQPDRLNAPPASAHRQWDFDAASGRWLTLLSPDGADGTIAIRQQAWLRASRLRAGESRAHPLDPARRFWLQVTAGEFEAGGHRLAAGDALGMEGETGTLALRGIAADSDAFLFDLPG